jgi:DnaK suppressor protein
MGDKKIDKKTGESFRNELLKMKEKILQDIKNMSSMNVLENRDPSMENAGHSMHMADVATDMYDREFNLGLASNDRELLQRINIALKKIEDGSYGLCTMCKEMITMARLKAIPYVQTCVKCQEALEKKR